MVVTPGPSQEQKLLLVALMYSPIGGYISRDPRGSNRKNNVYIKVFSIWQRLQTQSLQLTIHTSSLSASSSSIRFCFIFISQSYQNPDCNLLLFTKKKRVLKTKWRRCREGPENWHRKNTG